MPKAKYVAKLFFWNAIMSAAVFLPVFLGMALLQILVIGGLPTRTTFLAEFSNWIYFYIIFVLPLVLASLVYSLLSLLIPSRWSPVYKRLISVLLALLLPLTVLLLDFPGGLVYGPFYIPTIIATISYGLCAQIDGEDIEKPKTEALETA
jgi:hypothetical protein